jgi:hypothetical protein
MSKLVEAAAEFLSRDTFNKQTKNLSEGTTVHSDYEDGYGSVNVKVGDKKFKSDHYYNEEPGEGNYNKKDKANYHSHLKSTHNLSDHEAHAVIHHFDTIRKGKAKDPDPGHEDYQAKTSYAPKTV